MILKEIVRYGNENRRIEIINGIVIGSEIDLGEKKRGISSIGLHTTGDLVANLAAGYVRAISLFVTFIHHRARRDAAATHENFAKNVSLLHTSFGLDARMRTESPGILLVKSKKKKNRL